MGKEESYEGIIQTAWPVAYCRTFTDIPYTKEVFDELLALRGVERGALFDETQMRVNLAPQFEARQKLMDRLLKESGVKQILELASGLTTRGITVTQDPDVNYVETDLSAMLEEKKSVVDSLTKKGTIPARANLHCSPANALDISELEAAIQHFDPQKPVAIVNEGLLRYLNFDEKAVVAKNVLHLLKRFGGVWITPDISTMRVIAQDKKKAEQRVAKISKLTGRDISKNLFENPEQAQRFFEDLGFTVERHNFTEVATELVSPQRLQIPKEEVDSMIGTAVTFVLRAR